MKHALDKLNNKFIKAEDASKEKDKYICPCCGEPVILAAMLSKSRSPHFKHTYNNPKNKYCDNYIDQLGQQTLHEVLEKKNNVNFYFNCIEKNFVIGLKFSSEEILKYEKNNISLKIFDSEDKLLREIEIKRFNFEPDKTEIFKLDVFSWEYKVYFSDLNIPIYYFLFYRDSQFTLIPRFFKHRNYNDESSNYCKLIESQIQTKNEYFLIHPFEKLYIPKDLEIQIIEKYNFKCMNREFSLFKIKFEEAGNYTLKFLESWNYYLQEKEEDNILWPPYFVDNDEKNFFLPKIFEIDHYMRSVIESNSNKFLNKAQNKDIMPYTERIKFRNDHLYTTQKNLTIYEFSPTYKCNNEISFYFSENDILKLSNDNEINLSYNSEVKIYHHTYLKRSITLENEKVFVKIKPDIKKVLRHYYREEKFCEQDFIKMDYSDEVKEYLSFCHMRGKINSAVKRLILQGEL